MAIKPIQYKIPRQPPKPAPFSFPDGFAGGMNISVTADQIALNQSPDMLNMNYDNGGVPGKRYGFQRLTATSWGDTPIRGMHLFKLPDESTQLIVAWGGKLWKYDSTTDTKTDLCTGTKTSIADSDTFFFEMNGWLWAYNGTDYVYYDGVNPVGNVTDIAYVPILTLGGSKDAPGTLNELLNYLSDSWIDSYSPDGTATTFPLSFVPTSELVTAEQDNPDGTVTTYTEGVNLTVNRTATPFATVTFATAPAQGTDTLRIKATKTGMMDKSKILNAKFHAIYGGKNDTRVFFARENIRYRSGLLDPTYWPEDGFDIVGDDSEDLSGFGRMIDYLVMYKEGKGIYYSYVDEVEIMGEIRVVFPILPMNDEYGCVSWRTVQPAQNGLLALSREGVIWTVPSMVRGQANTKIVSRNINGRNGIGTGILDHTKGELEQAHAIIYDDKYMLHIGDKVYVLDLKYSNLAGGVYCWYPYDGVPGKAGCFLEIDSDLYLGDKEAGLLYKSYNSDSGIRYRDDGQPINAYWTSPLIFGGLRDWIKKFERLNVTFKGQPEGNHTLTIITDQGKEDILLIVETQGTFDYGSIDYGTFSYGVPFYPSSQSEKVGYKGEYVQWQIRNNNLDEGLTILAQSLQFSLRKQVK